MKTIIKLVKADIVTRSCGLNISMDTTREDVTIIFDADAAVEFAKDIMQLIPGGFDGSENLTPSGKWLTQEGADSRFEFETIDGKWWAFLDGEKHHALTDVEAASVIWGKAIAPSPVG